MHELKSHAEVTACTIRLFKLVLSSLSLRYPGYPTHQSMQAISRLKNPGDVTALKEDVQQWKRVIECSLIRAWHL